MWASFQRNDETCAWAMQQFQWPKPPPSPIRNLHHGRLQWGDLIAQDRLEPDPGATYQLRMPVRLLRQIFSVLLVVAYVSATVITVAPVANAAPHRKCRAA